MSRATTSGRVHCKQCRWVGQTTVIIEELSNVAFFECPKCGEVQEP